MAAQVNLLTSTYERSRSAFKRYLLYSCGLASIAIGVAVTVTFFAVTYATEASTPASHAAVNQAQLPIVGFDATQVSSYLEPFVRAASADNTAFEAEVEQAAATATPETTSTEAAPTPAAGGQPAPPAAPGPVRASTVNVTGAIADVNITFYDCAVQGFCGEMYNGEVVHEGAAACSWNLPLGTAFFIVGDPTGRIYICKDRGLLTDTWVDIFWHDPVDGYNWQAAVGRYGTIAIVSLP